jgi:hypothetical protein
MSLASAKAGALSTNKLRTLPTQREVCGITLAERTVTFVSESMLTFSSHQVTVPKYLNIVLALDRLAWNCQKV